MFQNIKDFLKQAMPSLSLNSLLAPLLNPINFAFENYVGKFFKSQNLTFDSLKNGIDNLEFKQQRINIFQIAYGMIGKSKVNLTDHKLSIENIKIVLSLAEKMNEDAYFNQKKQNDKEQKLLEHQKQLVQSELNQEASKDEVKTLWSILTSMLTDFQAEIKDVDIQFNKILKLQIKNIDVNVLHVQSQNGILEIHLKIIIKSIGVFLNSLKILNLDVIEMESRLLIKPQNVKNFFSINTGRIVGVIDKAQLYAMQQIIEAIVNHLKYYEYLDFLFQQKTKPNDELTELESTIIEKSTKIDQSSDELNTSLKFTKNIVENIKVMHDYFLNQQMKNMDNLNQSQSVLFQSLNMQESMISFKPNEISNPIQQYQIDQAKAQCDKCFSEVSQAKVKEIEIYFVTSQFDQKINSNLFLEDKIKDLFGLTCFKLKVGEFHFLQKPKEANIQLTSLNVDYISNISQMAFIDKSQSSDIFQSCIGDQESRLENILLYQRVFALQTNRTSLKSDISKFNINLQFDYGKDEITNISIDLENRKVKIDICEIQIFIDHTIIQEILILSNFFLNTEKVALNFKTDSFLTQEQNNEIRKPLIIKGMIKTIEVQCYLGENSVAKELSTNLVSYLKQNQDSSMVEKNLKDLCRNNSIGIIIDSVLFQKINMKKNVNQTSSLIKKYLSTIFKQEYQALNEIQMLLFLSFKKCELWVNKDQILAIKSSPNQNRTLPFQILILNKEKQIIQKNDHLKTLMKTIERKEDDVKAFYSVENTYLSLQNRQSTFLLNCKSTIQIYIPQLIVQLKQTHIEQFALLNQQTQQLLISYINKPKNNKEIIQINNQLDTSIDIRLQAFEFNYQLEQNMNLKLLINRFTLLKWDFTYLSFTDIDFSERIINSSNQIISGVKKSSQKDEFISLDKGQLQLRVNNHSHPLDGCVQLFLIGNLVICSIQDIAISPMSLNFQYYISKKQSFLELIQQFNNEELPESINPIRSTQIPKENQIICIELDEFKIQLSSSGQMMIARLNDFQIVVRDTIIGKLKNMYIEHMPEEITKNTYNMITLTKTVFSKQKQKIFLKNQNILFTLSLNQLIQLKNYAEEITEKITQLFPQTQSFQQIQSEPQRKQSFDLPNKIQLNTIESLTYEEIIQVSQISKSKFQQMKNVVTVEEEIEIVVNSFIFIIKQLKQQKNDKKDILDQVQVNILDISLKAFNQNTMLANKKESKQFSCFLSVSEFFIDDEVEDSKYKYIINKEVTYRLKPNQNQNKFLTIFYEKTKGQKIVQKILFNLHPIRVCLSGSTISFMENIRLQIMKSLESKLRFSETEAEDGFLILNIEDYQKEKLQSNENGLTIESDVQIGPLYIAISCDCEGLQQSNHSLLFKFLTFIEYENLKIRLKGERIQGDSFQNNSEIVQQIIDCYSNCLQNDQKLKSQFITKFGSINNFSQLIGSVRNFIIYPFQKGPVRGLIEGISELKEVLMRTSLNVIQKPVNLVKRISGIMGLAVLSRVGGSMNNRVEEMKKEYSEKVGVPKEFLK